MPMALSVTGCTAWWPASTPTRMEWGITTAGSPHIPAAGFAMPPPIWKTRYGKLSSHWQMADDTFHLDIVIPANTTSTVYLPAIDNGLITESGHNLSTVKDIHIEGIEKGYLLLKLGSGEYHFKVSH